MSRSVHTSNIRSGRNIRSSTKNGTSERREQEGGRPDHTRSNGYAGLPAKQSQLQVARTSSKHTPSPPPSASSKSRVVVDHRGNRRRDLNRDIQRDLSSADGRPAIWSDFYDDSPSLGEIAESESPVKLIDVPAEQTAYGFTTNSGTPRVLISSFQHILDRCSETDCSRVYDVELHACNLCKVSYLEKFTRLRVLDLSSNRITKVENLEQNKDLRDLKLYDNKIFEITGLEYHTELCSLQLQHNQITSIGRGLAALKKLRSLRLDSNLLLKLDIHELTPCVQLTYLDVSHNKIDSLAAVNSLPNLQELYATDNRIKTLSDLSRCRKLEEVDLSSNKLSTLGGLKGLVALSVLRLSRNHLTKLESMGTIESLRDLYVDHNQINLLAPLATQVPNLELLDVSENKVASWREVVSLGQLASVRELTVWGNPFCLPGGERPLYHGELLETISSLQVLDRVTSQKAEASRGAAPPMRPVSAAFVVTSRQVETQLALAEANLKDFEVSLEEKFQMLRSNMQRLPSQSARDMASGPAATGHQKRPASRNGVRSRLTEARIFAELHEEVIGTPSPGVK